MNATEFEQEVRTDLHQYLRAQGELDERMPDAPDIEEKWETIARAYLPDGIREFAQYPTTSLGWMMYIGMAVAQYWDEDWEVYGQVDDLYARLRDKRGYDHMDEYIRQGVLSLHGKAFDQMERLVAECASRTNSRLRRAPFEPGTKAAFDAYIACLRQLYVMGAAVWLKRMGYHMEELGA